MAREVVIDHADGSTDRLDHVWHETEEDVGKVTQATVTVRKTEVDNESVEFEKNSDDVFVDIDGPREFGGRLRDVDPGTDVVELQCESFEFAARRAEPSSGGVRYENAGDDTIITDALDDVDAVSPGTIENVKSGLGFIFSHATPAKRIREVVDSTGGFVRYNAERTVDYTEDLGTDRSTTISPANETVVDRFRVNELGGDEEPTHLRMLGAGEGKHQRVANVVPDADTSSYENKYTYQSDWESGDPEVWRVFANKDAQDEDTLAEQGKEIIVELSKTNVEVEATLVDVDVDLGDTFPVENDRRGIDQRLTVISLRSILNEDGWKYEATLSSRELEPETSDSKARKDTDRYNKAVEGTAVPINASGGRQPVNSTHKYQMKLYYPGEVEYEHRLNVRVIGLPYRAYSQGAAAGGDHTHSVTVTHPEHSHSVTVDHPAHSHTVNVTHPQHSHDVSVTHPDHSHSVTFESPNHTHDLSNQGQDASLGKTDGPDQSTFDGHQHIYKVGNNLTTTDSDSETSSNELGTTETTTSSTELGTTTSETSTEELGTSSTETSSNELGTSSTETSDASGDHTHPVDAGINETFPNDTGTAADNKHYPESCDVEINGTSQGTSFGDGTETFNEFVDIEAELNPGEVNEITVTSQALGHLIVYVEGDVYRQILGDG